MESPGQNHPCVDHLSQDDIRELMHQVRRLRITAARRVTERLSGEYHSIFKGQGIEFDEVREYAYGDDVRGIDWNVTARMGHPYIKRYREERELTMMLMVDVSGSLSFGTRGRSKARTAAELACLLALSADRNHDKVGLILFSDRIEQTIAPSRGRRTVMRILREILATQSTTRKTDIAGALRFLNRIQNRRAVVFLISDFLAPDFASELRYSARRHDLLVCRITDQAEHSLPAVGLLETIDPESGTVRVIDTSAPATRGIWQHWREKRDLDFAQLCRRSNIDPLELTGDRPVFTALHDLFRRRQRRTHNVTQ